MRGRVAIRILAVALDEGWDSSGAKPSPRASLSTFKSGVKAIMRLGGASSIGKVHVDAMARQM